MGENVHRQAVLYPGQLLLLVLTDSRLWAPQIIWTFWRKEKWIPYVRNQTRFTGHPAHSWVTVPNTLCECAATRQERIMRVQHGGAFYAFRHACRSSRPTWRPGYALLPFFTECNKLLLQKQQFEFMYVECCLPLNFSPVSFDQFIQNYS
jgi:hypothetical protein